MTRTTRTIQVLILAAAILGVGLLWEIYPLLPSMVFDSIFVGWALFVVDGALTFARPRISYYLGLVLSVLGLSASLPQSAHWAFIENGQLIQSAIFLAGSTVEVLIIVLVVYVLVQSRQVVNRRGLVQSK